MSQPSVEGHPDLDSPAVFSPSQDNRGDVALKSTAALIAKLRKHRERGTKSDELPKTKANAGAEVKTEKAPTLAELLGN